MKADFPSMEAFICAAWMLRCEVNSIRAVAKVEASHLGAFNPDGTPTILFERHWFHKLTEGKHDGARFNNTRTGLLSHQSWDPKGYGPVSIQHAKLEAAARLDRSAALKSCSWGLFQILGYNHAAAGYPILQRFINAMYREVDDHLRAFVLYIRHDAELTDAIRAKNWDAFARIYNGPSYATHGYHTRMAAAYASFK